MPSEYQISRKTGRSWPDVAEARQPRQGPLQVRSRRTRPFPARLSLGRQRDRRATRFIARNLPFKVRFPETADPRGVVSTRSGKRKGADRRLTARHYHFRDSFMILVTASKICSRDFESSGSSSLNAANRCTATDISGITFVISLSSGSSSFS